MKTNGIYRRIMLACIALLVLSATAPVGAQNQFPTPEEHFGFHPGTDRMMFKYDDLMNYIMRMFRLSGKMQVEQIGESELGKPIYAVFISSEDNIARLDQLKIVNRELALNGNLSNEELEAMVEAGRTFVYFTLSMHSNEVGPSQAAPVIIHELLTSTNPKIARILDQTVCVLVPCHNPDGMDMIIDHYNQTKNTALDGSSMPGVYHKYVGHNINRDFVTLHMKENKAVAAFYNTEWFPQVMIEKHQMGSNGPRYFVSPPHDPIAENVDAEIWNWMRVFGSRALTEMTRAGLQGISVNYLFDDYWPGSTTTAMFKGVIGMLSEAAGVNIASPIYIEPTEFRTIGKGLGEYAKSINMPEPWPGGWWRLSDIVQYEVENTISYLNTAAIHNQEILRFRNTHTRREIERGRTEAPFYYIMPMQQHDQSELVSLVNLMDEHGVSVYRLTADIQIRNQFFSTGDIVIPLAQPYRTFIKEVMEKQKFPVRRYTPDGEMIRPYDITSWSLPVHKGVEAIEINQAAPQIDGRLAQIKMPFRIETEIPQRYNSLLFTATNNESYKAAFMAMARGMEVFRSTAAFEYNGTVYPAGSFIMQRGKASEDFISKLDVSPVFVQSDQLPERIKMKQPRIALIESWFHAMDAGWVRFLMDTHQLPYTVLRPGDLAEANLIASFDVVIITDEAKTVLMEGKSGSGTNLFVSRYPPEYARGIGKKGLSNLLTFVDQGGKIISWGRSVDLFTGVLSIGDGDDKTEFQLPIRNIGSDLSQKGLSIPGSALRMKLRSGHPLTYGMPSEVGVFHRGSPAFSTSIPWGDTDRRVIGSFPDEKLLISGFAEKEELLINTAAIVMVNKGKGAFVFYGFSPHHRGQTPATYKLLWNAVLL